MGRVLALGKERGEAVANLGTDQGGAEFLLPLPFLPFFLILCPKKWRRAQGGLHCLWGPRGLEPS